MTQTVVLDDVTITRVVEQEGTFFDQFQFFPDWTPELREENSHWLEPSLIDPVSGKLVICVQSYVIRTPTTPSWSIPASATTSRAPIIRSGTR